MLRSGSNRLLSGSAIAAVLGMAVTLATTVAQAASTGSITLQGAVAASCNITVSTQSPFNSLDLSTTQSSLQVATVNEQCNDPKGYSVTMTTANGTTSGVLNGAISANPDTVPYTVNYGGSGATFASSSATVSNTSAKTAQGGVNKALGISYTGNSNLGADTYTDTLTLTITGK